MNKIVFFFNRLLWFIKWLMRHRKTGNSNSLACLSGKTAIVTGGSEGIGYATSVLLASRGCRVIIACRNDASAARDKIINTTKNPNIETKKLDLASLYSVRAFAEEIIRDEKKIDILINNAGALALRQKVTEDGLNALMQTNFFGAFLLTHLLIEPLKSSACARVIFLSSAMANFHTLTVNNLNLVDYEWNRKTWKTLYCNSKFCNILAAQEFAKKLHQFNIMVNASDTGAVNTEIYKKANKAISAAKALKFCLRFFMRDIYNGAQTNFHLASSENLDDETGQLYFRCERFSKPVPFNDEKFCNEIWRKSEELVLLRTEEKL